MAYYCNSCHITCHVECNPKHYHMPSYCSIIKHEWVKDQFDNSPTCSGCNNPICSPKLKASGYSCSKCIFKVHKTCRNLANKCESTPNKSSIFSNIRKSSTYLLSADSDANQNVYILNNSISSNSSSSSSGNNTSSDSLLGGSGSRDSTGSNNSNSSGGSSSNTSSNISILSKSMWTTPSTPFNEQGGKLGKSTAVPLSELFSSQQHSNVTGFYGGSDDLTPQQHQQQFMNNIIQNSNYNQSNNNNNNNSHDDVMFELDFIALPLSLNQRYQFLERMKQFFNNLSNRMECNFIYNFESTTSSSSNNNNNNTDDSDDQSNNNNNRIKYKTIAEIFHNQMLSTTPSKIRTPRQFNHYRLLIESFLVLYSNSWCEKTEFILRLALDFYKFLCTHKIDAENVLIGATPSKDIQRRVKKYFYISELDVNNRNNNKKFDWDFRISRLSLIENINAWSLIDNRDLLQKTVREFSKHLEKEKLLEGDIIIAKLPKNWNFQDYDSASSYFISDPNHHEFDEGSFIFGRYYKEADQLGLNCLVHLLPNEVKPLKIPFSRVVSLKMIEIVIPPFESTRMDRVEKFITNPFDAFISELRSALKESTKFHLLEQGLDVSLVGKGLNFDGVKSASLEDLIQIRNKITQLEVPDFLQSIDQMATDFSQFFTRYLKKVYITELSRNYQIYYYQESRPSSLSLPNTLITDYNQLFNINSTSVPIKDEYDQLNSSTSSSTSTPPLSSSTTTFTSSTSSTTSNQSTNTSTSTTSKPNLFSYVKKQYTKFKPFLPTLRTLISDIESGKKFTFKAKDSLNTVKFESDLAIENVKTYNAKLLDGSKKKELTGWYLQLIRESLDTFLKNNGYDTQAVPENYIDRPPDSLSKVKENLRIVNLILKPATPREFEERLQNLISPLKKKIYTGIDEFLSVAEILLASLLKEYKQYLYELSLGLIDHDLSLTTYSEEYLKAFNSLLKSIYNSSGNSNSGQSSSPNNTIGAGGGGGGSGGGPSFLSSSSVLQSHSMSASTSTSSSTPSSPLMSSTIFRTDKSTIVLTLINLIDDVLYIREMKQLEDKYYSNEILLEPSASEGGPPVDRQLSNTVPITGLLFSRLMRLKHEIRTVLEVWTNKDIYNFNLTKPGYNYHGVIIGKKDEYIKENRENSNLDNNN
ncbi:hypothetical protein DLAC_11360 [Tieghemostelium lacteum]|uniref:Phorbol-ester/DAG-type domain-containing protein n=1 Tax=Tieghemostelium lacteum TaxID=361077 RepID=A0A151Z3X5_TIELA|nr:hypothetical protein DLAC_11360 [Tieghemostelium lacteum]|eukprot:KYQ88617.1 hypothetical protein DLAC_11360 [Tieghemostelium lacteum]